uniref:HAT C-terminal dimerisation domain-containing protein n=1 Tax=Triticum urartu TaxID=4572 RepID=A0A8R7TWZ3_TRIUA
MACDVLVVPVSTVASEWAFSTSGRILNEFRTSLTPFMVQALICAQDWLRGSITINIEEGEEELLRLENELIEEFGSKIHPNRKQVVASLFASHLGLSHLAHLHSLLKH